MKSLPRILIFPLVLALMVFAGIQRSSAETRDSDQISQLLTQAKGHAIDAEDDAATLEAYARSHLSWQSHARKLDSMKDHINEMGKIAGQMKDLESQGSPWQQQAIQQVMPLLKDMAGNLSNTIQHLNENQSQVHMQSFKDYTRTNYQLAKRTADLIRDYVDYDQAKSAAESLSNKLELARN